MQDGSIQLAKPVCIMAGALENDHGAVISRSHLVHVRASTAYKDECARGEVEVADRVCMLPFKLAGRGKVAGGDVVVDSCKVGRAFLELAGMGDEEVFSREQCGEIGHKEGCHRKIEGKNWLDPMHHVVGQEAGRLVGGCAVSPKGERHEHWPMRVVAFTRLEDGVADGAVLSLSDPVCLRIVCQNANVSDAIPVCEPVESGHIGGAIVRNDLLHCFLLA